jgi:hypothetical protein
MLEDQIHTCVLHRHAEFPPYGLVVPEVTRFPNVAVENASSRFPAPILRPISDRENGGGEVTSKALGRKSQPHGLIKLNQS